jgi:hypothetical protein
VKSRTTVKLRIGDEMKTPFGTTAVRPVSCGAAGRSLAPFAS